MKKIFAFLATILVTAISTPPATAVENEIIVVTEVSHRNFNGVFRDDSLSQILAPSGRLGKLIYVPIKTNRIWVIDPALVDDVIAMTNSYSLQNKAPTVGKDIALSWITRLRYVTSRNQVVALPYGNPDVKLAKRLAPSELKRYYSYGNESLSKNLIRLVSTRPSLTSSKAVSRLDNAQRVSYTQNRRRLTELSRVVTAPELEQLRNRLAILLSSSLNRDNRNFFSVQATKAVKNEVDKIKINEGKYQLTSAEVKVPVTITNKYPIPVTVDLWLTPSNFRVYTPNIREITIPANSKLQLSMDVSVVAPGNTIVEAQLTDSKGNDVGDPVRLSLNLTVIDARVAWFTTSAAIILFLAAVGQSVRRIRRSKK
jgi:hypothetical protein